MHRTNACSGRPPHSAFNYRIREACLFWQINSGPIIHSAFRILIAAVPDSTQTFVNSCCLLVHCYICHLGFQLSPYCSLVLSHRIKDRWIPTCNTLRWSNWTRKYISKWVRNLCRGICDRQHRSNPSSRQVSKILLQTNSLIAILPRSLLVSLRALSVGQLWARSGWIDWCILDWPVTVYDDCSDIRPPSSL